MNESWQSNVYIDKPPHNSVTFFNGWEGSKVKELCRIEPMRFSSCIGEGNIIYYITTMGIIAHVEDEEFNDEKYNIKDKSKEGSNEAYIVYKREVSEADIECSTLLYHNGFITACYYLKHRLHIAIISGFKLIYASDIPVRTIYYNMNDDKNFDGTDNDKNNVYVSEQMLMAQAYVISDYEYSKFKGIKLNDGDVKLNDGDIKLNDGDVELNDGDIKVNEGNIVICFITFQENHKFVFLYDMDLNKFLHIQDIFVDSFHALYTPVNGALDSFINFGYYNGGTRSLILCENKICESKKYCITVLETFYDDLNLTMDKNTDSLESKHNMAVIMYQRYEHMEHRLSICEINHLDSAMVDNYLDSISVDLDNIELLCDDHKTYKIVTNMILGFNNKIIYAMVNCVNENKVFITAFKWFILNNDKNAKVKYKLQVIPNIVCEINNCELSVNHNDNYSFSNDNRLAILFKYINEDKYTLLVIDVTTGSVLWSHKLDKEFHSPYCIGWSYAKREECNYLNGILDLYLIPDMCCIISDYMIESCL